MRAPPTKPAKASPPFSKSASRAGGNERLSEGELAHEDLADRAARRRQALWRARQEGSRDPKERAWHVLPGRGKDTRFREMAAQGAQGMGASAAGIVGDCDGRS